MQSFSMGSCYYGSGVALGINVLAKVWNWLSIRSIVYCCIEDSLYYICSYDSEYNHVCWTYMGSNQSDRSCLAEDYLESHNSNFNRRK